MFIDLAIKVRYEMFTDLILNVAFLIGDLDIDLHPKR